MHPFELDIYREVGFLDHIEGLKNLLMKGEEESEKVNRKHSIKKKYKLISWHLVPSLHGK